MTVRKVNFKSNIFCCKHATPYTLTLLKCSKLSTTPPELLWTPFVYNKWNLNSPTNSKTTTYRLETFNLEPKTWNIFHRHNSFYIIKAVVSVKHFRRRTKNWTSTINIWRFCYCNTCRQYNSISISIPIISLLKFTYILIHYSLIIICLFVNKIF